MRKTKYILLLFIAGITFSQTGFNRIEKAGENLYFMYYDSSAAKSTIVEFIDFIVLIEAPIKNEAGSARNLTDHEFGGEKILRSLKNYFPLKPLRYFMHSHWHAHSISSINPFLRSGVTVVTTGENYNVIKQFTDTLNIEGLESKIVFVEDSLVINDDKTTIVAYRLLQGEYSNIPTKDYLYFYLPRHNIMHCGCMYNKWEGEPVQGKEMLTGREENLHRFLKSKNLNPDYLIRYSKEKTEANDMQPMSGLEQVINNGIRSADISKQLMEISTSRLQDSMDIVIKEILDNKIPPSIINTTVYTLLRAKVLEKANLFAKLQAMVNPSDPNSWDTFGETYFFLGNIELAQYYEKQSKKISPDFTGGGMETWQEDLISYKKIWENPSK